MSELQARRDNLPAEFTPPDERGKRISAADAARKHAIRIKDATAIRNATEIKLREMLATAEEYSALFPHGNNQHSRGVDSTVDSSFSPEDYCAELGYSQRTVQRWHAKLRDEEGFEEWLHALTQKYIQAVAADAKEADPFAKQWTGEVQWYTPSEYIESARGVLGTIDLDPASCAHAQQTVRAERFYTMADDGLVQPWAGTVWLNPPYKMPAVKLFCERLVQHVSSGDVTAAIILTNNATDTTWWHMLTACASAVCFTAGRISFEDENGAHSAPTNGQNFHYFGDDTDSFAAEFQGHGMILRRLS